MPVEHPEKPWEQGCRTPPPRPAEGIRELGLDCQPMHNGLGICLTIPDVLGRNVLGVSNIVLDVSASFKSNVALSVHSTASSCKSPRITTLVEIEEDLRIVCYKGYFPESLHASKAMKFQLVF